MNEEKPNDNISEEEIHELIRQINNQLVEKNIEDSGKTVLSTIHKAKGLEFDYVFLISVDEEVLPNKNERAWEEVNLFYTAITRTKKELFLTTSCWKDCSRYIKCLDRNLIELLPADLSPVEKNENLIYHNPKLPQSMAELLGDEGEEKVFKILNTSKKTKFKKLIKNWQEIDDLQIDIYAETKDRVYFIEVKNWSESFFYSPNDFSQRQEKIWQQQINRQQRINESFNSSKEIVYQQLTHQFY